MSRERQDELIEVLYGTCSLQPTRYNFDRKFCLEEGIGNFYHFILQVGPGEWVEKQDELGNTIEWVYTCGGRDYNLDHEPMEFPEALAMYYGAVFPLELEPWAQTYMNSFIMSRYAYLKSGKRNAKAGMVQQDIDDILRLKQFSAAEVQAILLELLYKADLTQAVLFKPFDYTETRKELTK